MTIQAHIEGGTVLEFPDGTDPAVIQRTVKSVTQKDESSPLKAVGDTLVGAEEAKLNLLSGAVAAPVAGVVGLIQGGANLAGEATGLWKPGLSAADRIGKVQEGLTYQPRTEVGQQISGAVGEGLSYLSEKPGEWGGEKTRAFAHDTLGLSPEAAAAAGAAVKTGLEVVPQALAGHGLGLARTALKGGPRTPFSPSPAGGAAPAAGATVADAATRAKAYVGNLGLDWDRLNSAFQEKLTAIAQSANGLDKLKPEAVKNQAILAEAGITNPTKGTVTRDPIQQRLEQTVKATDAGAELRQRDLDHNAQLLKNVDDLRASVEKEHPKAPAKGDLQVGKSVQDAALRKKASISERIYEKLYKKARETDPTAAVSPDAVFALLDESPSITHLGWVSDFMKKAKVEKKISADGVEVVERRPVSLAELYDLRVRANKIIKGGGPDAHYALDVKAAVDSAMEQAPEAAAAWRKATAAFKKHKQEFSDQGYLKGMVEDKPHSSDRRVALEDTARKVVTAPLEDLQKVKKSLLSGNTIASRNAGRAAWRDLKGWGLDYIREGMRGVKDEKGNPSFTYHRFKQALDDIGDDNLDELYGPSVRKQLRRWQEAAELVKTEASSGVKGSPTFDKIMTFLDRIGGLPVVGRGADFAGGAVKAVKNVASLGEKGREARAAGITPVDEAAGAARTEVRNRRAKQAAPAATGTVPAAESRREP